MVNEIQLITSERGKPLALLDLYKYRLIRTRKDGYTKWLCTQKSCHASIVTNGLLIHEMTNQHNHSENTIQSVTRQVLRENCKRKANSSNSIQPIKIIRSELAKCMNSEIEHGDILSIRKAMYDKRRQTCQAFPKSLVKSIKSTVENKDVLKFKANMANSSIKHDKDNLTSVLYGVRDLRLEQRPIPKPGDNEVLLKIQRVGICGSDVHYLVHGAIGHYIVKEPMVIGHEASGIVEKLGSGVKNLKVGDRVAIEPGVSCRMCQFCKIGSYNLCPDMKFCATPPVDGNLTRYYVHAADFCYKLPDHISLEEGALLEPLSVGVHACKRGGVKVGSTVLVLGAGPIGLVTLVTAKAMGASKIYITDLVEFRLNVAKEMGAFKAIKVNRGDSDEQAIENVKNEMGNELADVTIDCSGFQQTIKMGMELTKSGGVLTIVGMGASGNVQLPLFNALSREVDIRGVFRYANDYQDALSLITSGQINLKPLITHHFKIEESLEAFKTAETGVGDAIKVMIHCNLEH